MAQINLAIAKAPRITVIDARVPEKAKLRVAAYARVSSDSEAQLNSFATQVRAYTELIAKHSDWELVDLYADDGFTGTDADRDDFQRLLADVRAGKINCVIIKDLSRLSRDYVEASILIDRLFVQMSVRFISLHERIDSYKDPDSVSSIVVPITNVMNDQYCYQTSKKIRQVFDMKRRNGEFIAPFAPHGYIKDPKDKHKIIVDEEAAEVVKKIFAMFLDGMSKNAIAVYCNDHGIPTASEYKRSKGMVYKTQLTVVKPLWTTAAIDKILKNRLYTGDMVQGRLRVKSYKIHEIENIPESEWIIVENTHEAIIEKQTFDKVQKMLKRDTLFQNSSNIIFRHLQAPPP